MSRLDVDDESLSLEDRGRLLSRIREGSERQDAAMRVDVTDGRRP